MAYHSSSDPVTEGASVTPSDSVTLSPASRLIYCATAGNLVVDLLDAPTGAAPLTLQVAANSYHPLRVRRIRAATTAGGIHAFW